MLRGSLEVRLSRRTRASGVAILSLAFVFASFGTGQAVPTDRSSFSPLPGRHTNLAVPSDGWASFVAPEPTAGSVQALGQRLRALGEAGETVGGWLVVVGLPFLVFLDRRRRPWLSLPLLVRGSVPRGPPTSLPS